MFADHEDHGEREQARDQCEIEDGPDADMQGVEQKRGQERPEERARVVADALETEGPASVSLVH